MITRARQYFGFHKGTSVTVPQHRLVRQSFISLAEGLDDLLPEGREKELALARLQEAAMWSNAAVAMQAPLVDE